MLMSTKEGQGAPRKTYEDILEEITNDLVASQKKLGELVTKREEVAERPNQSFACEFTFLKKGSRGCLGEGPLVKENGWANYLITKAAERPDGIRHIGCHFCVEALRREVGRLKGRDISRKDFSTLGTEYWQGRLDQVDREIEKIAEKISRLELQEKKLREMIETRNRHRAHRQEVLAGFGITLEEDGDTEGEAPSTKTGGGGFRVSIGDELRSKSKEGRILH